MKIIVTGAAGFIGSNLVPHLIQSGYEVFSIDTLDSTLYPKKFKLENIRLSEIELEESPFNNHPESNFESVAAIIHLAALPGLISGQNSARLYIEKNVNETLDFLELARKLNIPKFIYISTSSVYGGAAVGDEGMACKPISFYGLSKLMAEDLVQKFCTENHIDFQILRLFSVYGPNQRPDMAIQKILKSILLEQEFQIFSSLGAIRTNTYVIDVCEAILKSIESTHTEQIYNISGEVEMSLSDWIKLCEGTVGKKLKTIISPPRFGDQSKTHGDIAKARELLGFQNQTPIKLGLKTQLEKTKLYLELFN